MFLVRASAGTWRLEPLPAGIARRTEIRQEQRLILVPTIQFEQPVLRGRSAVDVGRLYMWPRLSSPQRQLSTYRHQHPSLCERLGWLG
jgi:hypothetical protein